jgi:thiamine-monophosphate kinase
MDLSDGLLGDLPKICEASDLQAIIEEDTLPIPHAVRWSFPDWWDLALRGGEDFELLFTCPPMLFDTVTALFVRHGCRPPTRIGVLNEPNPKKPLIQLRRTDRRLQPIEPGAFDHFGGTERALIP